MRALRYAWEEAVLSLRRGRWGLLLSMATIAVALTMLGRSGSSRPTSPASPTGGAPRPR